MNQYTLYAPLEHVVVTIQNNLISLQDLGNAFGFQESEVRVLLEQHRLIEPGDTHFRLTRLKELLDCWKWTAEDVQQSILTMMQQQPDNQDEEEELFHKVPKKRPLVEAYHHLEDNDGIFEKVNEEYEEEEYEEKVVVVEEEEEKPVKKIYFKSGKEKKYGLWYVMLKKDDGLWPGKLDWDVDGSDETVSAIDLIRSLDIDWIHFEEICAILRIYITDDTNARVWIKLTDVTRILKHIGWTEEKCQKALQCFAREHRSKTKKGSSPNKKPRRFTRHMRKKNQTPPSSSSSLTSMLSNYLDPAYVDTFIKSDEFAVIKQRIIAEEVAKLEIKYLEEKKKKKK